MLPCFSQQSTFVNITTKDGLPSSECYGMLQDSKGYLWIRTLNGICRYNGKSFKTFTKKDGLKDNAVYAFHEDKSGRLWFITASSYVGFIENDSIKYIPCAEALARENGFGQKIFYTIITDTDRNLYVASHERAYKINSRKNYTEFDEIDQTDFYFKIARIDNNYFTIPDNSERVLKNADDNVLPVSIDGKSIEIGWEIKPKKRNLYRMLYPCKSLNGSMYFNCENILYCLNDNGVLSSVKYNEQIYFLFIDNQNNLWVGLNSGGLLMYKNADSNGTPKHFFENKSSGKQKSMSPISK